jgi:hypothetical protein
MKRFTTCLFSVSLALTVLITGCRETNQSDPLPFTPIQQPVFTMPQDYSGTPYQLLRADLDLNGYEEILALISTQTAEEQGFDSLVVFQYDTASKQFSRIHNSSFDRGKRVEVTNVNDDEYPEILVYTDAGGLSSMASSGLSILSGRSGAVALLRTFSEGRPRVVQIGPDSVLAISLLTNYGNILLKSQEVPYIDSLLFLKALDPDRERALKSEFLRTEISRTKEEYMGFKSAFNIKKTDETRFQVYSMAVQILLYYRMLDDMAEMNRWYQQEQQYWKENFTSDYLDMIDDAKQERISL